MPDITIQELQEHDDPTAFRTLNEEWISRHFVLEDEDRQQLNNPARIIRQGGHIFMAIQTGRAIGCTALIPMSPGVYQLSKMAVLPELRGLGIGRALLVHVIAYARTLGAESLFLGSSTKLPNAVGLYESAGFRHVPPHKVPKLPYTRADVFMELDLRHEVAK